MRRFFQIAGFPLRLLVSIVLFIALGPVVFLVSLLLPYEPAFSVMWETLYRWTVYGQ